MQSIKTVSHSASRRFRMAAIRRRLLPLAVMCGLSGCYRWQREPLPGPAAPRLPSPARLTMNDGTLRVMWAAAVEGDSIVGLVGDVPGQRTRTAVELSQVRRVQANRVDFAVTAGAATAIVVTILYIEGLLQSFE
jgi:hypothetical protein